MGTDTRHLVITIVAIFVAIAVGILLGIGITDQPSLDKLAARFEKEFEEVRQENTKLREEKEYYQEMFRTSERLLRSLLPSLVQKVLTDRKVALVETGLLRDSLLVEDIKFAVEAAGGEVTSVTRFTTEYVTMSAAQLLQLQKKLQLESLGAEITPRDITEAMARQIVTGQIASVRRGIESTKVVELSGEYRFPVDAVIILAGYVHNDLPKDASFPELIAERQKQLDFPLIETFKSLHVITVGVEPRQVDVSCMEAYQKHGISTVDNVESQVGLFSLVKILAGQAGHYGTKESSDRLMPELHIPNFGRSP